MKTRNRHLLEADPGGLAVNPSPQTVGAPKGWDSRHRLADRVRAHILLCMLACCGEWPMREAWRERLFSGEHLETKSDRDPIAPAACPTQGLEETAASTLPGRLNVRQLADPASGSCFRILLQDLASVSCSRDAQHRHHPQPESRLARQPQGHDRDRDRSPRAAVAAADYRVATPLRARNASTT